MLHLCVYAFHYGGGGVAFDRNSFSKDKREPGNTSTLSELHGPVLDLNLVRQVSYLAQVCPIYAPTPLGHGFGPVSGLARFIYSGQWSIGFKPSWPSFSSDPVGTQVGPRIQSVR